jgi:hypothetical protein
MALTVATLPTTHERGSEPTPLAAARASAPTEVIRIGGIIRSRPIRPHSVFALRFMQQRWCVLRSPGLGRSASTSTSCSRRRLRKVTVKSHWSRLRSTELSLRPVREWNGDTECPINSDERRLLAHFGHSAISELSQLSGVKRKLDFESAKGSFWRKADV